MSRDIVDADIEHYNSVIEILVSNYPIEFVERVLRTTLEGLKYWYHDEGDIEFKNFGLVNPYSKGVPGDQNKEGK